MAIMLCTERLHREPPNILVFDNITLRRKGLCVDCRSFTSRLSLLFWCQLKPRSTRTVGRSRVTTEANALLPFTAWYLEQGSRNLDDTRVPYAPDRISLENPAASNGQLLSLEQQTDRQASFLWSPDDSSVASLATNETLRHTMFEVSIVEGHSGMMARTS